MHTSKCLQFTRLRHIVIVTTVAMTMTTLTTNSMANTTGLNHDGYTINVITTAEHHHMSAIVTNIDTTARNFTTAATTAAITTGATCRCWQMLAEAGRGRHKLAETGRG
jgi:hypothetical protein